MQLKKPCKQQSYETISKNQQIIQKFVRQEDCLTAWLMLEGAELFSNVKPANLINIKNLNRPCGRNLYSLWKQHGANILEGTGLVGHILADRDNSLLLLLYNANMLETLIHQPAVQRMLVKSGYPANAGLATILEQLSARCTCGSFPHEIGILLGYPLKDVAAFMGLCKIPFSCQGPWKIYGDKSKSLDLADLFKRCRVEMAERLEALANSARIQTAPLAVQPFFLRYN